MIILNAYLHFFSKVLNDIGNMHIALKLLWVLAIALITTHFFIKYFEKRTLKIAMFMVQILKYDAEYLQKNEDQLDISDPKKSFKLYHSLPPFKTLLFSFKKLTIENYIPEELREERGLKKDIK